MSQGASETRGKSVLNRKFEGLNAMLNNICPRCNGKGSWNADYWQMREWVSCRYERRQTYKPAIEEYRDWRRTGHCICNCEAWQVPLEEWQI